MDTNNTLQLIVDKILDEGGCKITDNKFRLCKIDGTYFISENRGFTSQGAIRYETIHEFGDLIIALVKYSELVTEL